MKILKIFGIVAGLHVLALLLIFANPGCSSARSQTAVSTAAIKTDAASTFASSSPPTNGSQITANMFTPVPAISSPLSNSGPSSITVVPTVGSFPPPSASGGAFYSPTRPGTPAASAVEAQPVGDVTPATTYAARKGDSLWSIAKKNHLRVSELAAANNLRVGSAVRPGQKLIIPGKAAPAGVEAHAAPAPVAAHAASEPAAKFAGESIKYTVKSGETLGSIARHYHVRLGDLATANNISDPQKIRPGRELLIPVGKATGKKKGGSAPAGTRSSGSVSSITAPTESISAVPAANQDLDAGIKPAAAAEVPVIRIEAAPEASAGKP